MAKELMGVLERESYRGGTEVLIFKRVAENQLAAVALALVERWGMVAGAPDGEDSAGRARGRLQTPIELVTRACETAAALYDELERRGWLMDVPAPKEPARTSSSSSSS